MIITYHKATNEDVITLVDNRISFALELSEGQSVEDIQSLRNQMTNYFSKAIQDNTCISFIAKCDEEVSGIGSIHFRDMPGNLKNPSGKWGYIMNMHTVPKFRRNGICKSILNLLLEEGKKYGYYAFELHATKEGEKIYLQEGFIQHNEPTLRRFMYENN